MTTDTPDVELLSDIRDLLQKLHDMVEQFMTEPDTDAIVSEEVAALNRTQES